MQQDVMSRTVLIQHDTVYVVAHTTTIPELTQHALDLISPHTPRYVTCAILQQKQRFERATPNYFHTQQWVVTGTDIEE